MKSRHGGGNPAGTAPAGITRCCGVSRDQSASFSRTGRSGLRGYEAVAHHHLRHLRGVWRSAGYEQFSHFPEVLRTEDSRREHAEFSVEFSVKFWVTDRKWHFKNKPVPRPQTLTGPIGSASIPTCLDEPVKQVRGLPDKLVLNNVKHMDLPLSTSPPEIEKAQQVPQTCANTTGVFTRRHVWQNPRSHHQTHTPGDRHGRRSSSAPLQSAEPPGTQCITVSRAPVTVLCNQIRVNSPKLNHPELYLYK
jgi:hypothetical protein